MARLYLSFEPEAVVADYLGAPAGARPDGFTTGYVTVADGELYDGPGAKTPPGHVLAFIGPTDDARSEEALRETATLLRLLGHEVLQSGVDF